MSGVPFDPDCRRCARLAGFLEEVKAQHSSYFCRPVPPFGDPDPRLLVVGLAPGLHGANATGRPFTGDYAGIVYQYIRHSISFFDSCSHISDLVHFGKVRMEGDNLTGKGFPFFLQILKYRIIHINDNDT